MILVDFIPQHKLGKAEVTHAVNHTLPALIQRTGETVSKCEDLRSLSCKLKIFLQAARSRTAAFDFILRMSEFTNVHQFHLVAQNAVPPFKRDASNRLALSRVELVNKLLDKFGMNWFKLV